MAGIAIRYDWPLACIIGGTILMVLSVVGALRDA